VATVIIDQTSTHRGIFYHCGRCSATSDGRGMFMPRDRMAFKKDVLGELLAGPEGNDVFGKIGYSAR
jgi:hypothetical protein